MSDDFDEYDDFFNEIKKFFNFNSRLFDMDFFIFPEMGKKLDPKKQNTKGFKISYHFETGMDEPEIKIEGDIDEKDLQEYLKGANLGKNPRFKILNKTANNKLIDATNLSLDPSNNEIASQITEPYTEINDYEDLTEIIVEIPGIEAKDVEISFNEDGSRVSLSAQNEYRNYAKEIYLPFKTSKKVYDLDVNNGIAILKIWRN